eukprot:XP_016656876.1 PREDICTED: uncharacterized protein LOC100569711 isoform X2 [Acyrthosiphon pisum]
MAHNGNYNGPKESRPDDDSDGISLLSGDVNSVNKNDDGSNTDCGKSKIEDSDVPTTITDTDENENAKKLAAFVRKVLRDEVVDEKMEWPPCLLMESNRSVKMSQQELKNFILNKSAEFMATHGKSHISSKPSAQSKTPPKK